MLLGYLVVGRPWGWLPTAVLLFHELFSLFL